NRQGVRNPNSCAVWPSQPDLPAKSQRRSGPRPPDCEVGPPPGNSASECRASALPFLLPELSRQKADWPAEVSSTSPRAAPVSGQEEASCHSLLAVPPASTVRVEAGLDREVSLPWVAAS